jgi:hypothetical protein
MKLTAKQEQHIRSLEDKHGRITPTRLVEDAKRKSSPLHRLFRWDLRQAAEAHWIQRAREIIGCVVYKVTHDTQTLQAVCYVRDPSKAGNEGGYRRVDAVSSDPEAARESLIYTLETAAGHVRRALDLAGPLGLAREIDALLAEIVGVQRLAKRKKAA